MKEVQDFICQFIEVERELKVLQQCIGIDKFNSLYLEYANFLSSEMNGNLGITERLIEYSKRKADLYKDQKPPRSRELFKIEKYQHQELDELYFVYVSNFTPPSNYKNLDHILVVKKEDEAYKIIDKIYLPHFETSKDFTIENLESSIDLAKIEKFLDKIVIQAPDEETIPFTSDHIPLKNTKS